MSGPHSPSSYTSEDDMPYADEVMMPSMSQRSPRRSPSRRSEGRRSVMMQRQPNLRDSAESLVGKVLQSEGLHRYIDPHYLKREIAEANDMTQEEMERAAHELIASRQPSNQNQMAYYDQMPGVQGGYSMQDMQDYNPVSYPPQDGYAQKQPQQPVPPAHRTNMNFSDDLSDDAEDQMVYVTTL